MKRRHSPRPRRHARGRASGAIPDAIFRLLHNYEWQHAQNVARGGSGSGATFGVEYRKRYAVLYRASGGTRSALSFVDMQTGDMYRADSWKKPGRAIGNILRVV